MKKQSKLFTPPNKIVYTSDPEPWHELCAAIIRRACEDYTLQDRYGKDDVERFFHSNWFDQLSKSIGVSGDAIIGALRKNIDETGHALLPVWEPDEMRKSAQNRRSKEYYYHMKQKKERDENG